MMKRQLNDIFNHRMADRLRSLEIEQRRLANANFNISRQVASLDKLHGSMLELLEDVEGIQNKFEKTLPDIKREISKVEFNAAQISSEQGLLREEGHNIAKSIQAMAVSVSTLQEERENARKLEEQIQVMKSDLDKIKSAAMLHKEMAHNRLEKVSDLLDSMETNVRASALSLNGDRLFMTRCRILCTMAGSAKPVGCRAYLLQIIIKLAVKDDL